jgi:tetratricopeptide (TPR) repeat protein
MVMNNSPDTSLDPANLASVLRATDSLIHSRDYERAKFVVACGLDFHPLSGALLRRFSDLHFREGDLDSAVRWAESALEADPGDPLNYAHMSLLLSRQGRFSDALQAIERALEINPIDASFLMNLSQIHMIMGDLEAAKNIALQAVNLSPSNFNIINQISIIQQELADYEGAEATLHSAFQRSIEPTAVLRRLSQLRLAQGDQQASWNLARQAIDADRDDPANYDQEASVAIKRGDFVTAEDSLRFAATLPGVQTKIIRKLSDLLGVRGSPEEALVWAQRAIELDREEVENYVHLSKIYETQKNKQGASEALFAALEVSVGKSAKANTLRSISELMYRSNCYDEAVSYIERAIETYPYDAASYNHLAMLHLAAGERSIATLALQRAIEISPRDGRAARLLGDIALASDDIDSAFAWIKRAIIGRPHDPQNHVYLAKLYAHKKDYDLAKDSLLKALEISPKHAGLLCRLSEIELQLGNQDTAINLAKEAIDVSPDNSLGYVQLSGIYALDGDLESAENALLPIALTSVGSVKIIRRLGDLAIRRGDYTRAHEWLSYALKMESADPAIYIQIASLEIARGDLKSAEAALIEAIRLHPKTSSYYQRLVDLLIQQGKGDEALHWAKQLNEELLEDPRGYLLVGKAHMCVGRLDAAESAFRHSIELDSEARVVVEASRYLAEIAHRRGNVVDSLTWAQASIEADNGVSASYSYLAGIHLMAGDILAAAQNNRKALELDPRNAGALRRMSEITLRLGNGDDAYGWALAAVDNNPKDPQNWHQKALVLLARGEIDSSEIALQEALVLAPSNMTFQRFASYLSLEEVRETRYGISTRQDSRAPV